MNFWIERRQKNLDYTLRISKTIQNPYSMGSTRLVLEETEIRVKYTPQQDAFIVAMEYEPLFYSVVQNLLSSSCFTDHDAELKVFKKDNVREIWAMPSLMYMTLSRPLNTRAMQFIIKSPYMKTISSAYIR